MIVMTDLYGEKREQIPSESGPEGQTGKIISEQNAIEGQRKEVNVESYSDVAEIGQILKDFDFPARKTKFWNLYEIRLPLSIKKEYIQHFQR